jgi:hypothetical protein
MLIKMLTEDVMVFVILHGEKGKYLKIGHDHLLVCQYLVIIQDDISISFNDVLFLHMIMLLNV